jgi:oligoribonuclease
MLLAIDLETTGLAPRFDRIVEVGYGIAAHDFKTITQTRSHVITPDKNVFDLLGSNTFVREMHTESGLLHELQHPELTMGLSEVQDEILAAVEAARAGSGEPVHLFGSSVEFDFEFLKAEMPQLAGVLHHRVLNLSSLKMFLTPDFIKMTDRIVNEHPHRALSDIEFDLAQAKFYRFQMEIAQDAVDILREQGYILEPEHERAFAASIGIEI